MFHSMTMPTNLYSSVKVLLQGIMALFIKLNVSDKVPSGQPHPTGFFADFMKEEETKGWAGCSDLAWWAELMEALLPGAKRTSGGKPDQKDVTTLVRFFNLFPSSMSCIHFNDFQ